jgi:hypothetical protein
MVKQLANGSMLGFYGITSGDDKLKSTCIKLCSGAKTAKPFDGL